MTDTRRWPRKDVPLSSWNYITTFHNVDVYKSGKTFLIVWGPKGVADTWSTTQSSKGLAHTKFNRKRFGPGVKDAVRACVAFHGGM